MYHQRIPGKLPSRSPRPKRSGLGQRKDIVIDGLRLKKNGIIVRDKPETVVDGLRATPDSITEVKKIPGVQRHRQKKQPPLSVEKCKHLRLKLGDSGYYFAEDKRDMDLICIDCGTTWSIVLDAYSTKAKITLAHDVPKPSSV